MLCRWSEEENAVWFVWVVVIYVLEDCTGEGLWGAVILSLCWGFASLLLLLASLKDTVVCC